MQIPDNHPLRYISPRIHGDCPFTADYILYQAASCLDELLKEQLDKALKKSLEEELDYGIRIHVEPLLKLLLHVKTCLDSNNLEHQIVNSKIDSFLNSPRFSKFLRTS